MSTKWLFVHCFQIEMEFGNVGFFGGRKTRVPREINPWSRDENQKQTQPTYDVKSWNQTQATLVGGECSHHCAIPALTALQYKYV